MFIIYIALLIHSFIHSHNSLIKKTICEKNCGYDVFFIVFVKVVFYSDWTWKCDKEMYPVKPHFFLWVLTDKHDVSTQTNFGSELIQSVDLLPLSQIVHISLVTLLFKLTLCLTLSTDSWSHQPSGTVTNSVLHNEALKQPGLHMDMQGT